MVWAPGRIHMKLLRNFGERKNLCLFVFLIHAGKHTNQRWGEGFEHNRSHCEESLFPFSEPWGERHPVLRPETRVGHFYVNRSKTTLPGPPNLATCSPKETLRGNGTDAPTKALFILVVAASPSLSIHTHPTGRAFLLVVSAFDSDKQVKQQE